MFDVSQYASSILEDYMRMSNGATKTITPLVLAVALELQRTHGTVLAASYLRELGVDVEVAVELLTQQAAKKLPTTD